MSSITTAGKEDTAAAGTAGAKQATALNFFASTIICWAILLGAFVVDQMLPPEKSGTVIAVFSPATSAAEISVAIAAAEGQRLSETRYGRAVVVESEKPGFVGRLEKAGAVTVIAPMGPLGAFLLGNRAADFD